MKKIFKQLNIFVLTVITSFAAVTPAKAQVLDPNKLPPTIRSGPDLPRLITNVVGILMFVAGIASVIVIIVAGIIMTVSAGDEKRAKTARKTLLYAVIGLVISISAFAITSFINTQITK